MIKKVLITGNEVLTKEILGLLGEIYGNDIGKYNLTFKTYKEDVNEVISPEEKYEIGVLVDTAYTLRFDYFIKLRDSLEFIGNYVNRTILWSNQPFFLMWMNPETYNGEEYSCETALLGKHKHSVTLDRILEQTQKFYGTMEEESLYIDVPYEL